MTKLRIFGAFALFAVVCLLLPVRSFAQGGSINSITFGPMGTPKGGVTVTVCASTATVVGGVCTPAESDAACCFTDSTLGTRLTPPPSGGTILSDGLGNYTVWAAPGLYKVSYSGAGVTSTTLTVPVSCVPGGTNCTGLGAQLNANNVFTGVNSFKNMGSIRWADQFASTDAAIADLPTGATGGGTVFFKPGTYSCPTSIPQGVSLINPLNLGITAPPQIWSKFNGAAFNSFSAGLGSQNMVKFTCSGNFTLQDVAQVQILGIVWDMGNAGNFTIKGVSWSNFAMAVVNVPTTVPAVVYVGDATNNFNSGNNTFFYLATEGGNIGVSVGAATGNVATVAEWYWVLNLVDTQPTGTYTGIAWVGQCDSNRVHRHSVFTTNAISNFKGEVFNTGSPTVDDDADSIIVDWYEETMNGAPAASTSFTVNQSKGNIFTTGVTQSLVQTSILQPATTPYTWHETGQIVGTPNVEIASIYQATKALIVGSGGSQVAKIVTGSGTLTYTAIAANTCQEQALSVTGAVQAVGAWSASPTTGLGNTGLSWSAYSSPSGGNSVIVRVCNPTVGSITPTAVTWYVAGMQ